MPRRTYDPRNGRRRPNQNYGDALKSIAADLARAAENRTSTNTPRLPNTSRSTT